MQLFKLKEWTGNYRGDLLAGILVALALIPEAISFSIIAGVDPKVGLYACFMTTTNDPFQISPQVFRSKLGSFTVKFFSWLKVLIFHDCGFLISCQSIEKSCTGFI